MKLRNIGGMDMRLEHVLAITLYRDINDVPRDVELDLRIRRKRR